MFYINGKFLSQPVTGVQRFAIEITKRLITLDSTCIVLLPPNTPIPDWIEQSRCKYIGFLKGPLWEQISLPAFLNRQSSRPFLLNMGNTAPLLYGMNIATIHDISFINNPSWFSKKFALFYSYLIPRIAKKAKHVITVSEFVRAELLTNFKLDKDRTSVAYNAVSSDFKVLGNTHKKNFCLVVGSLEPRKNLKLVIDYFVLRKHHELIVIGKKSRIFNELDLNDINSDNITFTGFVPDEQLIQFYNKAKLFIFPSIYEGFGIPPIEAQSCGCPVVSSNTSAMPEVLEDSAVFFDPHNKEQFFSIMDSLLENETRLNDMRSKGQANVKRYDWLHSASKILNIMDMYK